MFARGTRTRIIYVRNYRIKEWGLGMFVNNEQEKGLGMFVGTYSWQC